MERESEPRMLKLRFNTLDYEEIKIGKVFARRFLLENKNEENPDKKWSSLTVKQIVEIWGYSEHYEEMIEHLNNLVKRNPDEHLLVHYDNGTLEENHNAQKLLGWSIVNDRTRKFGLVGGVLFHQGEMSFHT